MTAATDLAGRATSNLALNSIEIRALLAITFLYPVLLCAIFFPTPTYDLREYINLGSTFPLYTWKQPPLQAWAAGLVALTGARDAWAFMLAAQVLNFIGLAYFVLTARKFIGREAELPLIMLFCGSVYYAIAVPTVLPLNADQLLIPLWAGAVYHALSAARDNRWRDWLLCGVLIGTACLAKYFTVVLVAILLLAALAEPSYRRIFGNIRLYISGLAAVSIALIHVIPELIHGDTLRYGASFFHPSELSVRVGAIWHLVRSYVFYGLPAIIALGIVAWRGGVTFPRMPREPSARLLVFIGVGLFVFVLLLIIFFGLGFMTRYTAPYYGFACLALVAVVQVRPEALRELSHILLMIWGGIVVGTLVYSQLAINSVLREPAPAAAAELRAAWDRQYSCGPAYLVGDTRSAWGIAIYYGNGRTGVGFDEAARPDWFDPKRAQHEGLIVVTTPDHMHEPGYQRWFEGQTFSTLTLPYRRTLKTNRHNYIYHFVPPQDCPATAAGRR
jgi:hypothetical protein